MTELRHRILQNNPTRINLFLRRNRKPCANGMGKDGNLSESMSIIARKRWFTSQEPQTIDAGIINFGDRMVHYTCE
jgi:hypothetical protein